MSKINNLKQYISNNQDEAEIGDLVLNFFNKEFTDADYFHLFRQERWKYGVYCPFCKSINIEKQPYSESNHLLKYLCLDCNKIFEDDSESPLSGSIIPLQIWLQCWYLSQYCDSLQYIADKLNLDLNIIMNMINKLKHLFQNETLIIKAKQQLTVKDKNMAAIEEEFKKFLILGNETGKQPSDTAEYRRQKNIKNHNHQNIKNKPNKF